MRYKFEQYFGDGKSVKPYKDRSEELADRLKVVDILLENFMDIIIEHEQGLVFHRGVPMTPEQIEIIYEQEPEERRIDMLDDETAETVERAFSYIEKRENATKDGVFLPFRCLREMFELSAFEEFALMFSVASEENLTYGRMLGFLVQNKSGHTATYGAVLVLYEALFGEYAPIEYDADKMDTFFFAADEPGSVPGMRYFRTMQLYPPMRDFIFGEGEFRRDREKYAVTKEAPVFFEDEAEKLSKYILKVKEPLHIFMEGRDGEDILHLLSSVAEGQGKPLYLLDESDSEDDDDKIAEAFLNKALTARLYPGFAVLRINGFIDEPERESVAPSVRGRMEYRDKVRRVLERVRKYIPGGVIFLFGPEKMPERLIPEEYSPAFFPVPVPDRHMRMEIWNYYLAKSGLVPEEKLDMEELADRYDFTLGMIRNVVYRAAIQLSSAGKKKGKKAKSETVLTREVLLPIIFRRNDADFGSLATYIPAAYTWDDIEMDEGERRILINACNRFRYRDRLDEKYGIADRNAYGNGVSLLMYGPPGTGKTMAARVISSELALPLYRVDISQIFSKYIGETEKNLAKIFEEAGKANVILFFDEADALFAKRTDASDSNDKHANAQTAYLLQKIEEFSGMTLLATNLYHNFDNAFIRRITYVARFDAPDAATRKRLWENTLPDSVPMESDIDFDFIAERFELSGSNIKSILLSAAYMAGGEGVPVGAKHIIRAMRYEFVKLGRIIDPPEFGKYVMYLY